VVLADEQIAILTHQRGASLDNVLEYSAHLVDAVNQIVGGRAEVYVRFEGGGWKSAAGAVRRNFSGYRAIVLQYNPFAYGRWGFAPSLAVSLFRWRWASRRPVIALMAHEMYVPMGTWRLKLMGVSQRLQFLAVQAMADIVFVSAEPRLAHLGRFRPRRPTAHLPVASVLPDRRAHRGEARAVLGAGGDCIVLASFWSTPDHHISEHLASSANQLAASGIAVVLLYLGPDAGPLKGLDPSVRLIAPGFIEPATVSDHLAASDIFLAPFADGISTRRTSMMAALQHGLPIVATDGPSTDAMLRDSGCLRLVPLNRPNLFIDAVEQLATSASDRVALGDKGRHLYETTFDWPHLATKFLAALEAVGKST
jgi:glycosyltransferase involved in cell wall biosynthesis